MPRFSIKCGPDGRLWCWTLLDGDGTVLAVSEMYPSLADAQAAIVAAKDAMAKAPVSAAEVAAVVPHAAVAG